MDHLRTPTLPLPARKAVAGLGVALLLGVGGCGSDEAGESEGVDPNTETAGELRNAQLVQFGEAKVDPEQSEQGTYSELNTTQQRERLRETAELDKAECMDVTNPWRPLPEVRDAPASIATFPSGGEVIVHTLLEVPEQTAKEVVRTAPPKKCSSYQATLEDGTESTYALRELDLDTVGDASRALLVEVETTEDDGEAVMYHLVYHNAGYLGSAALLGPEKDAEHEETLVEFARASLEREKKVLG